MGREASTDGATPPRAIGAEVGIDSASLNAHDASEEDISILGAVRILVVTQVR